MCRYEGQEEHLAYTEIEVQRVLPAALLNMHLAMKRNFSTNACGDPADLVRKRIDRMKCHVTTIIQRVA